MKVLLCIGNEEIENKINKLDIEITDSISDLKTAMKLLSFIDADILIVNRQLDNYDGYDLLALAAEAKKINIKVIVLTESYEEASEKKLLSDFAGEGINVFLKFSEIDAKLKANIENYPNEFSYDIFAKNTGNNSPHIENEKVFSIEKRVLVPGKTEKIREIDKCVIAVVSAASSGKTFLSWNLEKAFADSEYNTALISSDEAAKYLYGIEEKNINLNTIKVNNELKDFSIELTDNRTVYTNTVPEMLTEKTLEVLVNKCKVLHDIIIIDTVTGSKENNLKAISLSNKVIIVFDLAEYNINKNLKLLQHLTTVHNRQDIIVVINNYGDYAEGMHLKDILDNLDINNVINISPVPGKDIYSLMGTSYVPADKNIILKNELQVLLKCIKAREVVRHKSFRKYIRKELMIFKSAARNYIGNKNTVKFLKFAVFLFLIGIIISILNSFGITPRIFDYIKNLIGGNE